VQIDPYTGRLEGWACKLKWQEILAALVHVDNDFYHRWATDICRYINIDILRSLGKRA
jgi:hypothetical protein